MAINLVESKELCCGCRACEHVCPFKAISMVEDECGFMYPSVDDGLCTECGACRKRCAFQSGYPQRKELEPYRAFGARHRDEDVFMRSRSGGAFVAISDRILERGGEVYGAGYDPVLGFYKVVHKCATDKEGRDEFCGSKYVQSDLGSVFPQIKESLRSGKTVLFSGTGCQVGALHLFLGREYDNLYTIDIVCHGVPSPRIWADYLESRAAKIGDVQAVDFRDKRTYGWTAHHETIRGSRGETKSRLYTRLFSLGMSRPCCYECVYCNKNRPGDMTIADFWGHEKAIPGKWDDDRGISLVLVNTRHGLALMEEAFQDLDYVECTGYPFRHTNLKRPTKKGERYDDFWETYRRYGFAGVEKKYGAPQKKAGQNDQARVKPTTGQLRARMEKQAGEKKKDVSVFNRFRSALAGSSRKRR